MPPSVYYPECRINLSAVFDGFGGEDQPVLITDVIPWSANVQLNSYKEADTWEVTFDLKRFPFSPELLRSCAVEIYLFQKPDQTSPIVWNQPRNLVSVGLIDNASMNQADDGGTITFSGRDYTSLLLDKQWDPTESGDRGRIPDGDLVEVVQNLVDEAVNAPVHAGKTLTVKFLDYDVAPETGTWGRQNEITRKKVTIKSPRTTKSRSRRKRGISVKADSNYWDVIYKLCLSYGFIVYVRGFDVIIAKPHVLQAESQNYYRMAYGRNLETLSVERKMAKDAVPQIRVRSYDPKNKVAIEGRFPGDNDSVAKGVKRKPVITGVGTKREEYRTYTYPDISDEKALCEIARSVYYTLARGEGKISFSTPHLKDIPAPDPDVITFSDIYPGLIPEADGSRDMLQMRPGDACQIVWDAFNAEIMTNKDVPQEQKVSALLSMGYSESVAVLVANNYSKLDYFRQAFYVKEVSYSWESDQGISIEVEAMNFVNPARDAVVGGAKL